MLSVLQRRAFALLIDALVFYFLAFVPFFASLLFSIGVYDINLEMFENPQIAMAMEYSFIMLFPLFFFFKSFFEYALSQTPGKMFLRIRVSGINSFKKSLLRNICFLFPLVFIFDLFPMVFSNQRFLEKFSNTEVVEDKEMGNE